MGRLDRLRLWRSSFAGLKPKRRRAQKLADADGALSVTQPFGVFHGLPSERVDDERNDEEKSECEAQ
jgi:hypothetical protein